MSALETSLNAVLGETVEKGGAALSRSAALTRAVSEADHAAWESIAEALDTLGFDVPEALPDAWRAALDELGVGGSLAPDATLADAEAAIVARVSLDGEHRLPHLPQAGETGLDARVLQFRLKTLGLFPYEVGEPYGLHDVPWAAALRCWLGPALPATVGDLAHLVGDVPGLWRAYLDAVAQRPILVLPGDLEGAWSPRSFDDAVNAWVWTSAAGLDPDDLPFEALHDFGRRLLGLLLWMNGFLTGAPGAAVADEVLPALASALGARGHDGHELRAFLCLIGKRTWVVNLPALHSQLVDLAPPAPVDGGEPVPEPATVVARLLVGSAENEADPDFVARVETLAAVQPPAPKPPKPKSRIARFFQRIYQGVKRAFEWTVRKIRDGLAWLHEHLVVPVRTFVSKVIAGLARGWRRFVDEVIPRVRDFFRGLVLNRSPDGKAFALTHLHLDADLDVVVSAGADAALVAAHGKRLRSMARTLKIVLKVLGQVIGLLLDLAKGPIGWAKAVFRIGGFVVDAFREATAVSPRPTL